LDPLPPFKVTICDLDHSSYTYCKHVTRDEGLSTMDGTGEEDCQYRLYIGKGRLGRHISSAVLLPPHFAKSGGGRR